MNWNWFDYLVAAIFILAALLSYLLISKLAPKHKWLYVLVVLGLAAWLWAELAVGVFTNWGS